MKNILTITQLSATEIDEILDLSLDLQQNNRLTLQGKHILFAFEKPSLRTKVGTEVAINHLGGSVIHISPQDFFEGKVLFSKKSKKVIKGRESLKDTVKNVSQWCDAIFARVYDHQTLVEITHCSDISVINALCNGHHPMQALADILTIRERFGNRRVSLAFVGDANNVAFSLIEIMLKCGHVCRFAGPKKYSFSHDQQKYFEKLSRENSGSVTFTHDPKEAVEDVDVVYTDTFVSMGEEDMFEEKIREFSQYQVNKDLFSLADKDAVFMHCLPAHRNVEVTEEIIDSENSLVYQQAKNRMVVAKGVFTSFLND